MRRLSLYLGMALLAGLACAAGAADWPQWRGPDGDGIVKAKGFPDAWPAEGLKVIWEAGAGTGYSSPIVHEGVLYLLHHKGADDVLTAMDPATGQPIWLESWPVKFNDGGYPGPRATPTIDGEFIYTYSGNGDLICRRLTNGREIWKINAISEAGSTGNLGWGVSSSPAIYGDLLYVQAGEGGSVALAVNKTSGKVAWKSQARGAGGYAPVIKVTVGRNEQLIVFGGQNTYGMDPATGRTLWTERFENTYKVSAATPIHKDGLVFVTSDYGLGCMMVRLTARSGQSLWKDKSVQSRVATPILDGDYLFANSEGTIKCLKWPDSKPVWENRDRRLNLGAGGMLVRFNGDKMLTMSESGMLSMSKMTPEGVELLGQQKVLSEKQVWATPLMHDGKIYVKGASKLICFGFGGE